MSTTNRTTFSRRTALKSGGIAALIAGLAGAAPAVSAAPELQATVVNPADLAAECRRLYAETEARAAEERAADDALSATLTTEQKRLLNTLLDRATTRMVAEADYRIAEIARHLPGVAPAIALLSNHTIEVSYDLPGRCCAPAAIEA